MKNQKNSLKTIWFFLEPYKYSFFLLFVICVLIAVFETLHVAILYPILQGTLELQSGLDGNFFLIIIKSLVGLIPGDDIIIANILLFIILTVLFFIFRMIYLHFSLMLTSKIVINCKQKVFQKFVSFDYQFFVDNKQGELLYKAIGAPNSISAVLQQLTKLSVDIVMSVSIFALLFSLSWVHLNFSPFRC